jgi:hypothetical protein
MVADLIEVTVKGCALLLSVDRVFSGINIDYESPFVSAPKQGIGGPAERIFQGLQSPAGGEYLVLESAQRGLPCSVLMLFAQGQPERRVHPQVIGDLIAILIARRNLIDSLPQQFEQRVTRMTSRSWVINQRLYTAKDVEPLIHFFHQKKACIGGHLCAPKINADGAVKLRPYALRLFVTNCAHAAFPLSYECAP